jgi:hypothetical protein
MFYVPSNQEFGGTFTLFLYIKEYSWARIGAAICTNLTC